MFVIRRVLLFFTLFLCCCGSDKSRGNDVDAGGTPTVQKNVKSVPVPKTEDPSALVSIRLKRFETPAYPADYFFNEPLISEALKDVPNFSLPLEVQLLCDVATAAQAGGRSIYDDDDALNVDRIDIIHGINRLRDDYVEDRNMYRGYTHSEFLKSLRKDEISRLADELLALYRERKTTCPFPESFPLKTRAIVTAALEQSEVQATSRHLGFTIRKSRDALGIESKDKPPFTVRFDTPILKFVPIPNRPLLGVFTEEPLYKYYENESFKSVQFHFVRMDRRQASRYPSSFVIDDFSNVYDDVIGPVHQLYKTEFWSPNGRYLGLTDSLNGQIVIWRSDTFEERCSIFYGGHDGLMTGARFAKWRTDTLFDVETYDGKIHTETFSTEQNIRRPGARPQCKRVRGRVR